MTPLQRRVNLLGRDWQLAGPPAEDLAHLWSGLCEPRPDDLAASTEGMDGPDRWAALLGAVRSGSRRVRPGARDDVRVALGSTGLAAVRLVVMALFRGQPGLGHRNARRLLGHVPPARVLEVLVGVAQLARAEVWAAAATAADHDSAFVAVQAAAALDRLMDALMEATGSSLPCRYTHVGRVDDDVLEGSSFERVRALEAAGLNGVVLAGRVAADLARTLRATGLPPVELRDEVLGSLQDIAHELGDLAGPVVLTARAVVNRVLAEPEPDSPWPGV